MGPRTPRAAVSLRHISSCGRGAETCLRWAGAPPFQRGGAVPEPSSTIRRGTADDVQVVALGRVTMSTELSGLPRTIGVAPDASGYARAASQNLRTLAIGAGIAASLLFVITGVRYELQMYGDGALFSYAVAVQDAWAFHCHNISGRLSVYLFAFAPAEAYIRLTGDSEGGVALYGLLFFILPFLGLIATFAADRSEGRLFFSYACVST